MTDELARWSSAMRDFPPDYADSVIVRLPPRATTDPAVWARTMFSRRGTPAWVGVALALRQALVPLIGVPPAGDDVFTVDEVSGDEALICADDKHLDFRCAVTVDAAARLVRVTTNVRFHGWRGRLYFVPVGLLHPVVVRSMLRRTQLALGRRPTP